MDDEREQVPVVAQDLEQLLQNGEYRKVVDFCEAIQLADELPPKFWFCKARAFEALGEKIRAIDAYRSEIASLKRVPPNILAEIGVLLGAAGNYHEGITCLRESFELSPSPELLVILADFLSRLGDRDQSREILRKALDLDPANDEAWNNLGADLLEVSPDEAERAFTRALELDPTRADSHGGLGMAYLAKQRFEEAIAVARKGLEREPLNGICHLVMGEGMEALGNLDGAQAAFSKAFRCEADKPGALIGLASVFERQGRLLEAMNWYGRGLRAWPDNRRIHAAYLDFAEHHGNGDPKLNDLCSRVAKQGLQVAKRAGKI